MAEGVEHLSDSPHISPDADLMHEYPGDETYEPSPHLLEAAADTKMRESLFGEDGGSQWSDLRVAYLLEEMERRTEEMLEQ